MNNWHKQFRVDPLPPLLAAEHASLRFFARRDLLEEDAGSTECLWELPEAGRILKHQLKNGAWQYPGGGTEHLRSLEDYHQIETFRQLGVLVEKYGLNKKHPAINRAADYLFSCQSRDGDFRGIYGRQYSPNYSAAIMELLIKAGYAHDPHIQHGFRWLLATRQQDGGWAIPLRTRGAKFDTHCLSAPTLQPDTAKPFSHIITGVVLRAFAAHPVQRTSPAAHAAGELLASRFFAPDKYADRRAASFWTHFAFPFWFTDLLSALDVLAGLGFSARQPHVQKALAWFISQQRSDGSWQLKEVHGGKEKERALWTSLAICRVFKRLGQ